MKLCSTTVGTSLARHIVSILHKVTAQLMENILCYPFTKVKHPACKGNEATMNDQQPSMTQQNTKQDGNLS